MEPASPAERAGIVPGTAVTSAEGHALGDAIDWQWHADGPTVRVSGVRPDGSEFAALMERTSGESWGITFESAVFDGIRTCQNRCAFCFMSQLPKGLRRSLYVRDDDYRLSFLQGNFVTLTNLGDLDVERIVEQHLSPLYVSLHAVTSAVRKKLVCARQDRALERFDELAEAGIDFHVQIVLVPGVNDGEELESSLRWLAERDRVLSVGIVPLGYTGHQKRFHASFETPVAATRVIEQVAGWQAAFRQRDGIGWVYLADEFYLNAGRPLPPAAEYDGFPQYENGIGIARSFMDDASERAADLARGIALARSASAHVGVICGELAAPIVRGVIAEAAGDDVVEVLPVGNRFFGGNVAVTGLLTAQDIVEEIASHIGARRTWIVPDIIANVDGLTLDDVEVATLGSLSCADVRLVSCDADGLLAGIYAAAGASDPTHDSQSR